MSQRTTHRPLPYSTSCFVCGRDNPYGLKLRFEIDDGWVQARCRLDPHYNGFLARTHGGVIAALVDEAMGWATVYRERRFSYTVELNVRYKLPVPVDEPLLVRARIARHSRRLSRAEAEIRGPDDELLVTGDGKFMFVTAEETKEIADALIYDPGAWRVVE